MVITLEHVKRLQAFTGEFVSMPGETRDALVEAAEALDELVGWFDDPSHRIIDDARAHRALVTLGVREPRESVHDPDCPARSDSGYGACREMPGCGV